LVEVAALISPAASSRGVEEGAHAAVRLAVEVERLLRGHGGAADERLFRRSLRGLLRAGLVRGLRRVRGLRGWWWEGVLKRRLRGVLVTGVLMRRVGGEQRALKRGKVDVRRK
jgi:hypothetical protein